MDGHGRLKEMEQVLLRVNAVVWLELRFPCAYGLVENVPAWRSHLNHRFEPQLNGK